MHRPGLCLRRTAAVLALAAAASGCSVRKSAIAMVADTLAGAGSVYSADDDPELVREATPFSLKLMEAVLAETPEHRALLTALCRGFAQYAYAFVELDAKGLEEKDYARSVALKRRARNLYLRARDYGLRGLEAAHPGFAKSLRADAPRAASALAAEDVEAAFWTGLAWSAAVSLSKDDPAILGDLPLAEALVRRAFALDPDHDAGAIHQFLLTFEGARPVAMGGSEAKAREHFRRAVELSGGLSAAPYVSLAETVSVQKQDRKEFEALLRQALAIDVTRRPEWRLVNLVLQQRARWLLEQADVLFVQ
jgi:tetratricopeptide (TPR) repeat protein